MDLKKLDNALNSISSSQVDIAIAKLKKIDIKEQAIANCVNNILPNNSVFTQLDQKYSEQYSILRNELTGILKEFVTKATAWLSDVVITADIKSAIQDFINFSWQEDSEIEFVDLIEQYWDKHKSASASAWQNYLRRLADENKIWTRPVSETFLEKLNLISGK